MQMSQTCAGDRCGPFTQTAQEIVIPMQSTQVHKFRSKNSTTYLHPKILPHCFHAACHVPNLPRTDTAMAAKHRFQRAPVVLVVPMMWWCVKQTLLVSCNNLYPTAYCASRFVMQFCLSPLRQGSLVDATRANLVHVTRGKHALT